MQSYRFDGFTLRPEDAGWSQALSAAHATGFHPLCLCQPLPALLRMYVSRLNDTHVLKRMPFTGPGHAPSCDHYDPPPELSGYGQVNGSAVRDDAESDTTTLALDFALTKGAARAAPASSPTEHESVRADGTKLTLRAALHYLYDQAQLTRWTPRMQGKRNWYIVRRELLAAAAGKKTKGMDLPDLLFIPEPFSTDDLPAIAQRRARALTRLAASPAHRMIVIAPLKEIRPVRFGYQTLLKHLPDMPLQLDLDIHQRLVRHLAKELAAWDMEPSSHLLVMATVSQPQPGLIRLESVTLMNVDANWLPFDSLPELRLLDELVRQGRRFTKGLRYNLPRDVPLAAAILQDTTLPTALFVVPGAADASFRARLDALKDASDMVHWHWSVADGVMPGLPMAAQPTPPQGRAGDNVGT